MDEFFSVSKYYYNNKGKAFSENMVSFRVLVISVPLLLYI